MLLGLVVFGVFGVIGINFLEKRRKASVCGSAVGGDASGLSCNITNNSGVDSDCAGGGDCSQ